MCCCSSRSETERVHTQAGVEWLNLSKLAVAAPDLVANVAVEGVFYQQGP